MWDLLRHVVLELRGDGAQAQPRHPQLRGSLHLPRRSQPRGGKRDARGDPPAHATRTAGARRRTGDETRVGLEGGGNTRNDANEMEKGIEENRKRKREGGKNASDPSSLPSQAENAGRVVVQDKVADENAGTTKTQNAFVSRKPTREKTERIHDDVRHVTQPIVDVPIYGRITALELFRPKVREREAMHTRTRKERVRKNKEKKEIHARSVQDADRGEEEGKGNHGYAGRQRPQG